MLYERDEFRDLCAQRLSVSDIETVIAVRAHAGNPWVLERLTRLAGHYDPSPVIRIVDYGSEPAYASAIEAACEHGGHIYQRVDETAPFSLARARNLGAAAADSELLLFNDVDCFGARDMYARLVDVANHIELGAVFDQMINLPAYYLSEDASAAIDGIESGHERAVACDRAMTRAAYAAQGTVTEMVAPYSNVFLCHRGFFHMTGGFNESFRGHGSEDFEYLLRFAAIAGQFPLPSDPTLDRFGPASPGFYRSDKGYRGFRRLLGLVAFQAECAGLRIAHLWHPKPDSDPWMRAGDRGRKAFHAQTRPFIDDPRSLLGYDWLPRDAAIAVPPSVPVGHAIALRLAGYRLDPHATTNLDVAPGPYPESLRYSCHLGGAEPTTRQALGFARDGKVYALGPHVFRRAALERPTTATGYAYGRLSIGLDAPDPRGDKAPAPTLGRRIRKLARDPKQFLEDSRIGPLRWIGRKL